MIQSEAAKAIIYDYSEAEAPALLLPTKAHDATRGYYNTWLSRIDPQYKTGNSPNWAKIVAERPEMVRELSDGMMEAAFDYLKTEKDVREKIKSDYYRMFEIYKTNQEFKREYRQYEIECDRWQQQQQGIYQGDINTNGRIE